MKDPFALEKDTATYSASYGNELALYNDGATSPSGGGAFHDIVTAIKKAKHFVFIADWSFHPLVRIEPKGGTIGDLLVSKVLDDPSLLIAIHTWNHTVKAAPDPQNDAGGKILDKLMAKGRDERKQKGGPNLAGTNTLLWRMSSRTGERKGPGFGWSHHQKFVVLDTEIEGKPRRTVTAFFGGLDLTKGRFDWPAHANLPEDKDVEGLRTQSRFEGRDYDDWYNAEFKDARDLPRQSWHDIHARLTGPAAWDFIREFVGRWTPDKAVDGVKDTKNILVVKKFQQLVRDEGLIQPWEQDEHKGCFKAQVLRSISIDHWGSDVPITTPVIEDNKLVKREEFKWPFKKEKKYESSIQQAYLKYISLAERFIYIETQYFIGSGSRWGRNAVKNGIPEALVRRILAKAAKNEPFHVYFVVPLFPEGDPTDAGNIVQRYFQSRTIEYMITTLNGAKGVGDNWKNYISFYFLAEWCENPQGIASGKKTRKERVQAAKRYMIYVHSKLMICDDAFMILGSANLNERSLAGGRDTEICVGLWPDPERPRPECIREIQRLRAALWSEHLGLPGQESDAALKNVPWKQPESPDCISKVQQLADKNYWNFRSATGRSGSGHLCRWPFLIEPGTRRLLRNSGLRRSNRELEHELIPDHLADLVLTRRATLDDVRANKWSLDPDPLKMNIGPPLEYGTDILE